MAEPTKADLSDKIDKIAGKIEESAKEFKDFREGEFKQHREMSQKYFNSLDTLKTLAVIFSSVVAVIVLGGIGYVYTSISSLSSSTAALNANVSAAEKSISRTEKEISDLRILIANQDKESRAEFTKHSREINSEMAKQGRDIGRLEGIIDTLVKENKKLATMIEKNRPNFANVKVEHGYLVSAKEDTIRFMLPSKVEKDYTVTKDTIIMLDGKDVMIANLYPLKIVPAHIYFINDHDPYSFSLLKIEVESRRK